MASRINRGKVSAFPASIKPMLATLTDKPSDQQGWIYEVKWDGYRALALRNKKQTKLISRNNKSFDEKFYPVFEAVKDWKVNAVIDGEICVLDSKGVAHFSSLQNWRTEADGELIYYVFDLLWLEGRDLTGIPLVQRRQLLREILPDSSVIRMSEDLPGTATELFEAVAELGMEGIMAKRENSLYFPGERSGDWLKIKSNQRHEVVIGGFTINENSPKLFSSLLVGLYENKRLIYTGKIGTGFSQKTQKDMMQLFKPLKTSVCPFAEIPDVNKPSRFRHNPPHATVTWLKPKLVCEVSYTEITGDGVMRHPSFEGMRDDKPAKSVKSEKPTETKLISRNSKAIKRNDSTSEKYKKGMRK